MQPLSCTNATVLRRLARTYVWWKEPDEALRYPKTIASQVMKMGDWKDVMTMVNALDDDYLKQVLQTAQAGQFDEKSWHYWHYRLGLASLGKVPPLPCRKFA